MFLPLILLPYFLIHSPCRLSLESLNIPLRITVSGFCLFVLCFSSSHPVITMLAIPSHHILGSHLSSLSAVFETVRCPSLFDTRSLLGFYSSICSWLSSHCTGCSFSYSFTSSSSLLQTLNVKLTQGSVLDILFYVEIFHNVTSSSSMALNRIYMPMPPKYIALTYLYLLYIQLPTQHLHFYV